MKHTIFAVLFIFALLLPVHVFAESYQGLVVGISDGDTFKLLVTGNKQIRVRLAEIDTPESAQPYGSKARQELSGLIFGKTVTVNVEDTDRYGRTVGRVSADGIDVNAEMIRRGAAWVYRQYVKDQSLFGLEEEAKQEKRGLWNLPESERVPPWEWRLTGHSKSTTQAKKTISKTPQKSEGGFTCAGKRICGQMTSCAEARFYLEQCGLSRLDGDHDGVPCESICR